MAVAIAAIRMPAPAADSSQGDESVKVVRETLKGPVIQTMRRLIPDLAQISEEAAYDHALANLGLLEKCFKAFRDQRDRFKHLLVDKSGRVVTNDTGILSCGHNLEVVIAMIVRTAAKRYFRNHVGLDKTPKFPSAQPRGLLNKVRTALSAPGKQKSLAEELYDCIKGYLLFEWQVPLVPTYAKLSPEQITSMGRNLLQYTDVAGLAKAAGLPVPIAAAPSRPSLPPAERPAARMAAARPKLYTPQTPIESKPLSMMPIEPMPPPRAEQALPARPVVQPAALRAAPIMTSTSSAAQRPPPPPGTKKLSGASFAAVLDLPQVQAAIDPLLHGNNSVRIIDLVGARAWAAVILTLGLRRKDQLAVFILNAFGSLGAQEFMRIFGNEANPEILEILIQDVTSTDINPNSSLPEVIAFVTRAFAPNKTSAIT